MSADKLLELQTLNHEEPEYLLPEEIIAAHHKEQTEAPSTAKQFLQAFFSLFLYSDYQICVLVLKVMIIQAAPLEYSISLAYIVTYFSVAYFSFSYGFTDTTNIYCSQLRAKNENARVNLILRQAMGLQLVFYLVLCLVGTFALSSILSWFQVSPEIVYMTKMMGLSLSPAFICRNITDILKCLVQVEDYGMQLGMVIPGAILVSLGFGYIVIYYCKFYLYGFSLALLLYEAIILITIIIFLQKKLDQKLLDFKISIFENIFWFLKECLKTTLTQLPSWLTSELVIALIAMSHDDSQIAAFSIFVTTQFIMVSFSIGFIYIPIIQLNKLLGSRDFKGATNLILKTSVTITITSIAVSLILFGSLYFGAGFLNLNELVRQHIQGTSFVFSIAIFFQLMQVWVCFINISYEDKYKLTLINTFLGFFFRSAISFLFINLLEYGVLGAYIAEGSVKLAQCLCSLYLIVKFDENKFKGTIGE